ncbi:MAG: hypothetical protein K2L51_05685 [Clostridiales bacterium]|nr:hypothetical protein [Clostridiales bacterium]
MANAKSGTSTAAATANTETAAKKLYVEREEITDKKGNPYTTDGGEKMFAYVLKGQLQGKNTKVDFVPKDKGGYEVLAFVFGVADKAELIINVEEMETEDGRKTRYNSYLLRTIDSDGVPWECEVKPQRNSDKSLLKMLCTVGGIPVTIY